MKNSPHDLFKEGYIRDILGEEESLRLIDMAHEDIRLGLGRPERNRRSDAGKQRNS